MKKLWSWVKRNAVAVLAALSFAAMFLVHFLMNDRKASQKLREERARRLKNELDDVRDRAEERDRSLEDLVRSIDKADDVLSLEVGKVEGKIDVLEEAKEESDESHEERLRRIEEARGFEDVRFK